MKQPMKYAAQALCILLLLSCRNEKEGPSTEGSEIENPAPSKASPSEISTPDREAVIKSLLGVWKEPEYPFRRAEFQDSLVKFVEEGVVEPPEFREFEISRQCPFEVNNIRDLKAEDIILVMPEAGTCEELQVSRDSIVVSGFSVTTGEKYRIVYEKLE